MTSDKLSSRKENTEMKARRRVEINLHDLDVGIWQDDANDPSFRRDVFNGLIRHLRRRGWTFGPDQEVAKRWPSIAPHHRRGSKGSFHATLEISGRYVGLKVWAETWTKVNSNGHRHDFDKRKRLGFLDRLRFDLEIQHLLTWARHHCDVTVKDRNLARSPHRGGMTAMEWIAQDYAESWHVPVRPGWPRPAAYNSNSADDGVISQGADVWLRGRGGRWFRGRAFANINNMWWVVLGPYDVENRSSRELYVSRPLNLREKLDVDRRRKCLESEWTRAIRADDYTRAALLKGILFGDDPIYRIYKHTDGAAYYGPNFAGYTADLTAAGRYSREEAEREVLRVPHLLTLICPDGHRIRGEHLKPTPTARPDLAEAC